MEKRGKGSLVLVRIVAIILTIVILLFFLSFSIYYALVYNSPLEVKSSEIGKENLEDKKEFVEQKEKGFFARIEEFIRGIFGAKEEIGGGVLLAPPACGSTITANLNLDGAMTCSGTALIVGANDITIDCVNKNVNTITYGAPTGNAYGISVGNKNNVVIKNCKIINGASTNVNNFGIVFTDSDVVIVSRTLTIENTDVTAGGYNLVLTYYSDSAPSGTTHSTIAKNSNFEAINKIRLDNRQNGGNVLVSLELIDSLPRANSVSDFSSTPFFANCQSGYVCPKKFTEKYTLDVHVQDVFNAPIAGAQVDVKQNSGTGATVLSGTTDASGNIPATPNSQALTDQIFERNKLGSIDNSVSLTGNYNPHSLSASKLGYNPDNRIITVDGAVTLDHDEAVILNIDTTIQSTGGETFCREINTQGSYTIEDSPTGISGTCLTINANDVTIDGKNNIITISSATAFQINGNNANIRDINIGGGGTGYNFGVGSSGGTITNSDVSVSSTTAVVFQGTLASFYDSLIDGTGSGFDIFISDGTLNLYNTILTGPGQDGINYFGGTINKYWNVDVHAQDEISGSAITGASVDAISSTAQTTSLGTTDASGDILFSITNNRLLEYVQASATRTMHSPYAFNINSVPAQTINGVVNSDRTGVNKIVITADGTSPLTKFLDIGTTPIGQTPCTSAIPSCTVTSSILMINTSITERNLKRATFRWQVGADPLTDYNIFDSSTKLLMNFDNTGIDTDGVGGRPADTSPNTLDWSGNGNDGTVTGAVFITNGKHHGAFEFESLPADDDRIDLGSPASLNFGANADKSYTIVAWIYPRSFGEGTTGNFGKIVDKSSAGSNTGNGGYTFYIRDTENDLGAGHGTGVNSPGDNIINLDSWQQVAIVYSDTAGAGGTISFYVNGVNYGSQAVTAEPGDSSYPVYIGNKNGLTRDFDGYIDEVMMWNRPLTDNEIKQLYYSNLYKYATDEWRLNVQRILANDVYKFQTFAEDKAGNTDSTEPRTVTINSPLPSLTFVEPPTPAQGGFVTTQLTASTEITVNDLGKITSRWQVGANPYTDYNIFDSSTKLLMNFDNTGIDTDGVGGRPADTSPNTLDWSGNGNDGTVTGATVVSGKYGNAFEFDGLVANDDRINLGSGRSLNFGANADKSYTIAAWIYPRTAGEGGFGRIVDRSTSSSNGGGGYTFYTTGSLLTINNAGSGAVSSDTISPSLLNKWSYVVVVFNDNADTVSFYVDGASKGVRTSITSVPGSNTANSVLIGNRNGFDRTFDGYIDEVMMWNRTLTSSEIQELRISNLRKYTADKFRLDVVRSGLTNGNSYTFQTFAEDKAGNLCSGSTCSTGSRTVTVDLTFPSLIFVTPPTPANGATVTSFPIQIGTEITERNLKRVTFNWDGIGYNIFDSSTKLLMNLDNVAALGESVTLVKDMSGNGNDGIANYMDLVFTSNSKYGKALEFNRINDRSVRIPSLNGFNKDYGTISLWIAPNNWDVGSNLETLFAGQTAENVNVIRIQIRSGKLIYFDYVRDSMNIGSVQQDVSNLANTEFHHFTATWAGNQEIKLYLDGELVQSAPMSFTLSGAPSEFFIGREYIGSLYNGRIDEVMLFDRVLTASEIQQLYFSNLRKYNIDNWRLDVEQGGMINGVGRTFQTFAEDKAGNTGNTELRTVTININPGILDIYGFPTLSSGGANIVPAGVLDVSVSLLIRHFSSLTSVNSNFRHKIVMPEVVRSTPNSCVFDKSVDPSTSLYKCVRPSSNPPSDMIPIQYYDPSGEWDVRGTVLDSGGRTSAAYTDLDAFFLNSMRYINNDPSISFGSLFPGTQNTEKVLGLRNIGNELIDSVTLRGRNLIGESQGSYNIGANNFAAKAVTGSCSSGVGLEHNTENAIPGFSLSPGDNSQGQGLGNLYICLKLTPSGLPAQIYSAKGANSWAITFPPLS